MAELPGIVPRVASALKQAGVELLETLVAMDQEQLHAVPALTDGDVADLRKLIEENIEIVEEPPPPALEAAAELSEPETPDTAAELGLEGEARPADAARLDAGPATSAVELEPAATPAAPAPAEEVLDVRDLPGLPESLANSLISAGLDDIVELVSMTEQQLLEVEGLSADDVTTLLRVVEENVEVVEEDETEEEKEI